MRNHEKVEQEAENLRYEWFDEERPMMLAGKVWMPKQIDNTMVSATPTPPSKDIKTIVPSATSITSPSLEDTSEPVDIDGFSPLIGYPKYKVEMYIVANFPR